MQRRHLTNLKQKFILKLVQIKPNSFDNSVYTSDATFRNNRRNFPSPPIYTETVCSKVFIIFINYVKFSAIYCPVFVTMVCQTLVHQRQISVVF